MLGTPKEMKTEVLSELDFICGDLDFILGGVSSHKKTVQQGCAMIRFQLFKSTLGAVWRMECRAEGS